MAREEAFDASAYKYLYIRYPLAGQVANALALCGGLTPRLGLDVEDESFAVPWATWVDQIQKAIWTCQEAGVLPEIYTSAYKWRKLTGNSTAFADLPLHAALYDGTPTLGDWGGPYGGWERATIKQYHNTTDIGLGVSVDLNVRFAP